MRKLIPSAVCLEILVLATLGFAQDPVKLSPQYYNVLLDNGHVRVLEYRLKPGEKEPMRIRIPLASSISSVRLRSKSHTLTVGPK
jgi:hypothetical protein